MLEKIKKVSVAKDISLLQALKKMDEQKRKLLYVFDGEKFMGIVTIGDIQRAILGNVSREAQVASILSPDKIYACKGEPLESIKEKMQKIRAESMPVVDENGELADVYFWDDFFAAKRVSNRRQVAVPVVIMAGGKGERLKPLTNVLPKPLVPVGEKTVLEAIMDQFETIGCTKFYMSVNYKKEMIKFYLSSLDKKYDVEFFTEDKPLGTIGSVALLKGKITTPFFVSNCDIVIDQDLSDVYGYHIDNKNDITIVTALKSYRIPYGVIETGEDGLMKELVEKPEISYMINTGVYILNPELINEIPSGEFFHITQLIGKVRVRGGRIGCFPVSDGQWKDVGEWSEYLKMLNV